MKHNYIAPLIVAVLLALILIVFCVALATPAHAYDGDRITTARQEALHEAADILRACGYADDSEVIRAIQADWRAEQERLDIIAKVIDHEAPPEWCEWEHSVAVGVELKPAYFETAVINVRNAETELDQTSLF